MTSFLILIPHTPCSPCNTRNVYSKSITLPRESSLRASVRTPRGEWRICTGYLENSITGNSLSEYSTQDIWLFHCSSCEWFSWSFGIKAEQVSQHRCPQSTAKECSCIFLENCSVLLLFIDSITLHIWMKLIWCLVYILLTFIPRPNTEALKKSFSYRGALLWDGLSEHLTNAPSFSVFKRHLNNS